MATINLADATDMTPIAHNPHVPTVAAPLFIRARSGSGLFAGSMLALGCIVAVSVAATTGDAHAPHPAAPPAAKPEPKAPQKPASKSGQPSALKSSGKAPAKAAGETDGKTAAESPSVPAPSAPEIAHPTAAPAPAASPHPVDATAHATPAALSADAALRRLVEGNARFVHDLDDGTHRDPQRRAALAKGQNPFAIVLCCSDSRVPPELVFDTDLGDLFVVRIAGNSTDDVAFGSIEYAVEHLGTKLILVMGHTKCGAVKAAVDTAHAGASAPALSENLAAVIEPILVSVRETTDQAGDAYKNALIRNVQRTVAALRTSDPTVARLVAAHGVQVLGGVYDLETGQVNFVPDASERESAARSTTTVGAEAAKAEPH